MKNKRIKVLLFISIASLSLVGVSGCGSTQEPSSVTEENSNANSFAYTDDTETELISTTILGSVSSVDGNKVTLNIGGSGAPEPPDSQSKPGTPDGENTQDTENPGETQPEKPDNLNEENSETTQGTPPDAGNMGSNNQTTGETSPTSETEKTGVLTIADTSVLVKTSDNKGPGENATDTESSAQSATLEDISEGTMLAITFDENGAITQISISQGFGGGGGPQSSGVDHYDASNEYTSDTIVNGETLSSTGTDENAALVSNGANVTFDNVAVNRTSSDSTGGDNASFYGVGAGLLTTDGTSYVNGGTFTTDAAGGAGIFSYGTGVTYVKDVTITTKQDTSGGIHVAGGGTLYAWDLNVETDGASSAAIRSDRGGGTMVIDGGTYTSNGVGSPAIYCTADIAANNATLTATGSEAICMEGLNTIHLFDCDISGNMSDDSQNDTTWDVIVYQSMSGDSEVGNSTMQIVGGSLEAKNGGLFYTTNTEANILLSDVDITYADDSEFFLQCTGNTNERGWGTAGANGSDCTFTAQQQAMQGDVIWDSISQLDFYMENGSSLTGAVADNETWAGNGGDGYCNLSISKDSTWTVTGDSTLTNLYNEGTIVDDSGKTVTIKGTDGTVYVNGESSYTITVNNYQTTADFSGAAEADSFSSHETEVPTELTK